MTACSCEREAAGRAVFLGSVGAAFTSDFARKTENSVDTEIQREEIADEFRHMKWIVLVLRARPVGKGMMRSIMQLTKSLASAFLDGYWRLISRRNIAGAT